MDIKKYILAIDGSSDYYNRYESDVNLKYAEKDYDKYRNLSNVSDLHKRAWTLANDTYYNTACTREGAERWARALLWAKGYEDWKTRKVTVKQYTDSYHPDMWRVSGCIPFASEYCPF